MIYENFFIKAKKELLTQRLPLEQFKKEDGNYMTIPEYLATFNHTVERFSTDGYFLKGFGFNYKGLKEFESKLASFGLEIDRNIWILSPAEVQEELKKDIWNTLD